MGVSSKTQGVLSKMKQIDFYDGTLIRSRTLENEGVIDARVNHIDNRIVSLGTFLDYEIGYGKVKEDFTKSRSQALMLVTNRKNVKYFFVDEPDQTIMLEGKKYRINGFPQQTNTMLSLDGFRSIFVDDNGNMKVDEGVPLPIDDILQVKPSQLLKEITDMLKTHVGLFDTKGELRENMYTLIAYWVMQTYIYDVWSKTSYLKIQGTHESGKSTLSRILQLLTFNSKRTTGKISESSFYRGLNSVGGVQCLDEIDVTSKDLPFLNNILNAGWSAQSEIHLTNAKDHNIADRFNVYSPKIIAGTQASMIDPVLGSRMLEITMCSAPPGYNFSSIDLYDDEIAEQTRELRDKLYMFRLLYGHKYLGWKKIAQNDSNLGFVRDTTLKNRQLDLFAPLLTIARKHGGAVFLRSIEDAILEQREVRGNEFFETFEFPILQVIYEYIVADREMVKDTSGDVRGAWMSPIAISDTVVGRLGGFDNYKRAVYTQTYSAENVIKCIKALGISTESQRDIRVGVKYKFVLDDVKRYLMQKNVTLGDAHSGLTEKYNKLYKLIERLQDYEDDWRYKGVPIYIIEEKLDWKPETILREMAMNPKNGIVERPGNRWGINAKTTRKKMR